MKIENNTKVIQKLIKESRDKGGKAVSASQLLNEGLEDPLQPLIKASGTQLIYEGGYYLSPEPRFSCYECPEVCLCPDREFTIHHYRVDETTQD